MIQDANELDKFYEKSDPWDYEQNPDDIKRKRVLLSEIPAGNYGRVLDIGCGHGFVTRDLPGNLVIGTDISSNAVIQAGKAGTERVKYVQASLFDLGGMFEEGFDLVIITGVLYPQYIGNALNLVYLIIDGLLKDGGILVSVHIDEWYRGRFPYLRLKEHFYNYREYTHRLEVYVK